MKRKIIVTGPEARSRVLAGAKFAADTVKLTLGPFGRNFASGVRGGPVAISNDGVSLLKEIEGRDEIEDLGVRAVREAATKINDKVGDGTTGGAYLTYAVLEALDVGDKDIIGSRRSPVEVIEQIRREKEFVITKLDEMTVKIETEAELIDVARVSGEYKGLAEIIGKAQHEVGIHGTVIAEEANSDKDEVEYIHGIRLDNGYTTSRLINNDQKQILELENCYIILTNKIFRNNFPELQHILDGLVKIGALNVILMGGAFDDAIIGLCVKNIEKGSLRIFPINAPYVDRNEIMEDLAAISGGKYINAEQHNLETMQLSDVGHVSKVVAKRFEGIIAGYPKGKDQRVDALVEKRIEHLEEKKRGNLSPFELRNINARLSQFKAGTAVIRVGADTEQERKHKKDKVDDAVNAVKAAFQEGVVPGAGLSLKMIADELSDDYLLKQPLYAIHRQIMSLAPSDFEVQDWVRDPVKVIKLQLEHACSIASSLATTEVAINWEREKPKYVTSVDTKIGNHMDAALEE